MTLRIFISSTAKDLADYREAVKKAILELEQFPHDMLDWGSQPGDATEVSLEKVRRAEVFVGIIAHRYGYVPEGGEKSVTEMEYDEAKKRGIPRLMYVVDPNYTWEADRIETDGLAQEHLAKFKARVEGENVRSTFTTPDDLARKVARDLVKVLEARRSRQRIIYVAAMITAFVFLCGLVFLIRPSLYNDFTEYTGLATATPLEGKVASDDEVLLVIANFKYIDEDATQVEANLEREFERAGIDFVRVHHIIESREQAQAISDIYNATLVMWGEVARGGVVYEFEVTPRRSFVETTVEGLALSAVQLENFEAYIFEGMDSLYVVDFTLGQILYFEKDYETSLEAFSRAVDRIPVGREEEIQAGALFFYRGTTYYVLEENALAIFDYEQAIQINPHLAQVYHNRGTVYSELGDYEQAITDYSQAIQINPKDARTYNNRGTVYYRHGNYEPAIANLTQAIQLDPDLALPYTNRGAAYADLGDYELAIANLTQAIQLDPDLALAYYNRGLVYSYLGDYKQAITDYTQAIQLNPDYTKSYHNRGLAHYKLGNYEPAIADLTQAIQLDPDLALAYYNRGNTYSDSGNYEQALTDYTQAIQLDPDFAEAYAHRGTAYYELGDYEQAIADYTQTIQLNPNDANTYFYRGLVYGFLGDFEQAIENYAQALQLNPNDALVYFYRGLAYYGLGDYKQALDAYTQAIQLNSDNPDAYFYRGNAYYETGEYKQALADYTQVIQLEPNASDAFWGRGISNYELGNYEAAIADYHEYERLTGQLTPFMEEQIAAMEAALTEEK